MNIKGSYTWGRHGTNRVTGLYTWGRHEKLVLVQVVVQGDAVFLHAVIALMPTLSARNVNHD